MQQTIHLVTLPESLQLVLELGRWCLGSIHFGQGVCQLYLIFIHVGVVSCFASFFISGVIIFFDFCLAVLLSVSMEFNNVHSYLSWKISGVTAVLFYARNSENI